MSDSSMRPRASRTSVCCDMPLGVVSEELLPSWLVAVDARARMSTSSTGSEPSLREVSSATRTIAAHPSLRPYPSAVVSRVLHRPTGDNAPSLATRNATSSPRTTPTPTTTANVCSPPIKRRPLRARCAATREDEQAVSIAAHAPFRSSVKATRPAAKLGPDPVLIAAPRSVPSVDARNSGHSPPHIQPTCTDPLCVSIMLSFLVRQNIIARVECSTTNRCAGSIATSSANPTPRKSGSHELMS